MKKNFKIIVYLSVILLSISSMFSSCARNPVTGKQEFMLLSENDEIKMGQQTDVSVVQMYGVYEDDNLAKYIDELGQKMAKISHRPNLKYEFKVMDSPVINAFAVPGGYVYITRGILAHLNNEAELAGVVGHEIGHVTARHSAQKYSETYLANLGIGVGSMISKDFANFAGLAAQGLGLLFLRFSRDDERQSDVLGVEYSTAVGYDAREMSNFFNTLDRMRAKSDDGGLPDWFSTHPNPADRVEDVRKEAEKKQQGLDKNKLKISRKRYLSKINGLIYGENPRQGFVEKDVFYHPDLKFKFPVPSGWKLNNLPSQVQMIDAKEKGIMLFTLAGTPSSKAAADQFIEKTKAKVAKNEATKVNGLKARKVFSEIKDGSNILRIQSYFIELSGQVYEFHGFSSSADFDTYQSTYTKTMTGFGRLKNKAKLNVKPDRMKVIQVEKAGTLKQVLDKIKVAEDEQKTLALLNGLKLTDKIKADAQIKIIQKGK